MLKAKMGSLYWDREAVREVLRPRPEGVEPPAILDVGTGSGACFYTVPSALRRNHSPLIGSWVVDMAEEFPHAEVVGIDLVPANLAA